MTLAYSLLAFAAGVVGHKGWRVAWRVHRHPVSLRDAVVDEFAPTDADVHDRKRARAPRVTEVC